MSMPIRQSMRVGSYLMRQKLAGNKKFPLIVELEPLFACNLKCAGCGKIQQPHTVLKQRMPVEQALAAVEECGAMYMAGLPGHGETRLILIGYILRTSRTMAWTKK